MIANTLEVAVVGCSLLLTVDWTLGTVHIQDYSPVLRMSHGPFHPMGIHLSQPLQVLLPGQGLRLKPPNLAGAGGLAFRALPSHDYSHGRVLG